MAQTLETMRQRRADWQRRTERDHVTYGPFHTITQMDREMVRLYDREIAAAERAHNTQVLIAAMGEVETRFEARARRADDQDNAPRRNGGETW